MTREFKSERAGFVRGADAEAASKHNWRSMFELVLSAVDGDQAFLAFLGDEELWVASSRSGLIGKVALDSRLISILGDDELKDFPPAEGLFGATAEELAGRVFFKTITDDLGCLYGLAAVYVRTDVASERVRSAIMALCDAVGSYCGSAFGFEKRRASTGECDQILDFAPLPVLALDLDGFITNLNPKARDLLKVKDDEVVGQKFDSLFLNKDQPLAGIEFAELIQSRGEVENLRLSLTASDGSAVEVLTTVALRRDETGVPFGRIAFGQDITAIRGHERTILQKQKMEALGELTAGISHDFNNFLNIIIGNLRYLRSFAGSSPEIGGVVDDAMSAAGDAAELVERLLKFSRSGFGEPKKIVLLEVIDKILGLVSALGKDRVRIERGQIDSDLIVQGDIVWLESSLLNLINNALDAIGENDGFVRVAAHELEVKAGNRLGLKPGNYASVSVEDSGEGIPASLADRVFDPFFTTKEPGFGTGLGLSMVLRFCQRAGGTCEVNNQVGRGAAITMWLPSVRGSEKARLVEPTEKDSSMQAGHRLLVVEDDERVRRVVVRDLRSLGFDCVQAGNVDEAIDLLQTSENFSLVFSDVMMPGDKDGFDLVDWIRSNRPDMPVLLTSAYVGPEGMRSKDVELVPKPYEVTALEIQIRSALAQ